MTLNEFYQEAHKIQREMKWRSGQAIFNLLFEVRPDLSEQVRATDKDPFFSEDSSDPRFERFVTFLGENWDKVS